MPLMTPAEKVKREMHLFREALPELLKDHAEQWVVFVDGAVADFYQDEESAYRAAMERFGPSGGFVVAPVVPERPQPTSFALLFGVAR